MEIESIKARLSGEEINIFSKDSKMIGTWDFDIPNCRGMIYNMKERLFKVFESKKYGMLFTIPYEAYGSFDSHLSFGSSPNMKLIVTMLNEISVQMAEILLRIYSKLTGQLRKANFHTFIHTSTWNSIVVVGMQIFDISSKIAKVIKISDIQMIESP